MTPVIRVYVLQAFRICEADSKTKHASANVNKAQRK
jgi:hypothetical protein